MNLTQSEIPAPRGYAIQARINMESMGADGTAKPSGGTLTAFELPSGPGVRVDTFGYAGYTTNPNFDSLLAKLVAHSPSSNLPMWWPRLIARCASSRSKASQANIAFLQSLLKHPEFIGNRVYTRFIEDNIADLVGDRQRREWPQAVVLRSPDAARTTTPARRASRRTPRWS